MSDGLPRGRLWVTVRRKTPMRNAACIGAGALVGILLVTGSVQLGNVIIVLIVGGLLAVWQRAAPGMEADPARDIGELTTARLRLRATVPADIVALAEVMDDEVVRTNGWPRRSRQAQLRLVRDADVVPVPRQWVMAESATGTALGVVAINEVDPELSTVDVGWFVGPAARGQGYGTEAAAAAVEALHRYGYRRVTSATAEDNLAVRRILEKIGATVVERRRRRRPDGTTVDAVLYAHEAGSH